MNSQKTSLLYMDDFDVTSCDSEVVNIDRVDGQVDIVLAETCFYPKGGGQDYDKGVISSDIAKLEVEKVSIDDNGVVHHIGRLVGDLQVGDMVGCEVDIIRRTLNTKLHSAGHVLDMAVSHIYPDWVPGRGAHYPDMSFVEYGADVNLDDRDKIVNKIQAELDKLTSRSTANTIKFTTREELEKICRHVPDYLPTNKPIRAVLYDDFAVPCGGTHVSSLDKIGRVLVTKFKIKDGKLRISYKLSSQI